MRVVLILFLWSRRVRYSSPGISQYIDGGGLFKNIKTPGSFITVLKACPQGSACSFFKKKKSFFP